MSERANLCTSDLMFIKDLGGWPDYDNDEPDGGGPATDFDDDYEPDDGAADDDFDDDDDGANPHWPGLDWGWFVCVWWRSEWIFQLASQSGRMTKVHITAYNPVIWFELWV